MLFLEAKSFYNVELSLTFSAESNMYRPVGMFASIWWVHSRIKVVIFRMGKLIVDNL